MADQTPDGADRSERSSLDLDALAVSDRFRLFNFTRRDDHVAYLWVLRALDRLRGVHQVQAHPDEVAAALAELAAGHDEVPRLDGGLREKLDALAEDGVVHRLEDASRAGSLARYRNRQSVYQFSELGYRAFAAVEDVLSARIRDANLSRLVFSDILDDLRALAAATKAQDQDQVYRRLSRLDTVLDDMSRRAAQFHLTLGEVIRSTDTSPDTFLRYKNALLAHMTEFMAELDRYLPRLAAAVAEVEGVEGVEQAAEAGTAAGTRDPEAMLRLAAEADERPFLGRDELLDDWRRRWAALRAWFAADDAAESRAAGLRTATRAAVSAVIALLRQVTEAQRGGVNRSSQLRHLAEWVFSTPDEGAAYALMSAAFNISSARHLGGAHDDAEQTSSRAGGGDAPGVEISVTLFRRRQGTDARVRTGPGQSGDQGRTPPPPGGRTPSRTRGRAAPAAPHERVLDDARDESAAAPAHPGHRGPHGRRRPPGLRRRRQRRAHDAPYPE